MSDNTFVGSLNGYLVMALAITATVAIAMTFDIQISLSRIDPDDHTTWPNMAPQIRYYFIPIVALPLVLGSVLAKMLLNLAKRCQFRRYSHWAALGFCYGIVGVALPLVRTGLSLYPAIGIALAVSLGMALWVRRQFGILQKVDAI
jgi:hypothetical protein